MTAIDSPDRPKLLNGVQCWTTDPLYALPAWLLRDNPEDPSLIWIDVVVHGCWESVLIPLEELPRRWRDWRDSPEECFEAMWGRPAPRTQDRHKPLLMRRMGNAQGSLVAPASAEELGL